MTAARDDTTVWQRLAAPLPADAIQWRQAKSSRRTLMQRWAARVALPERPYGCWLWTGSTTGGYGVLSRGPARHAPLVRAHRYAYERFVGPIPAGLQIDHLCRNRACVNPLHLEAVPQRENIRRGVSPPACAARKDTCPKGHPFNAENTRLSPRGRRVCRRCHRETEYARRHPLIVGRHYS